MSYEPTPSHSFGGLNLRDAPDEVGLNGAIDLLNVELDRPGMVRTRYGYGLLTSSALTNIVDSLQPYYTTGGTKQLLAGCDTRLEAIATDGSIVASQSGLTTSPAPWDFARFGAPGSEVVYAGNANNLLYKWNGSAWASVSGSPKARCLAVMAVDQGNRLVAGGMDDSATDGPGATQTYSSRIHFSDPGLPETWTANNYVDLTPGDGELVRAIVVWREFVFVFKETKYFVFYGTSTDSEGNPIFNYRTVDTGIGLASSRAVTVGRDGVYFMARNGIYRTFGGDPEYLSRDVEPLWLGGLSSFYQGSEMSASSLTATGMLYLNERIYLAFPGGGASNSHLLVYDPNEETWTLWDIPCRALGSFRAGDKEELVFGVTPSPSTFHIGRYSSSYTNDNGSAMVSRYRTGFYDYAIEEQKTIREAKLWGTGTVNVAYSDDFGSLGTATSVTLGSSPAIAMGLVRKATQGTVFSHQISATSGAWTVHRFTNFLRETRPAGLDT